MLAEDELKQQEQTTTTAALEEMKPEETETQTLEETKTTTPEETETQTQDETKTTAAEETETNKPEETETQKTDETETKSPSPSPNPAPPGPSTPIINNINQNQASSDPRAAETGCTMVLHPFRSMRSRLHVHAACSSLVQNQNNNVQTVIVQQSTQLELLLQNLIKMLASLSWVVCSSVIDQVCTGRRASAW